MGLNLRGDQGAVTWSGSPTMVDGTNADIDAWEATITRKVNTHRPFGWALPKVTLGGLEMRGRFHIVALDGQALGIPAASTATNGTLVLASKGSGTPTSTNKYTVAAQIWALTTGANSTQNNVTDGWYEFVGAADDNADTIVAA